jgi:multidrug efflux pump subunit AcrB
MKKLINYFIEHPAWPNVIKIMVLLFGLIAVLNLKSSFFPLFEQQIIQIQITYPGASPEEIEKGIVQKIEDNLKGLQGIERYTSKSKENIANITIETFREYDVDEVLLDVKNAVNRINTFPAGMEPPVVFKLPTIEFAISFSLSGDLDIKSLKNLARRVESDLRETDGISQIELSGFPDEEIAININEKTLRSYGLTFSEVARAVQQENIDLTAGSVKTDKEEILIRLEAKEYYAEKLEDIVVKSDPRGDIVRLGEIAEVKNTWEENPQKTYIKQPRSCGDGQQVAGRGHYPNCRKSPQICRSIR